MFSWSPSYNPLTATLSPHVPYPSTVPRVPHPMSPYYMTPRQAARSASNARAMPVSLMNPESMTRESWQNLEQSHMKPFFLSLGNNPFYQQYRNPETPKEYWSSPQMLQISTPNTLTSPTCLPIEMFQMVYPQGGPPRAIRNKSKRSRTVFSEKQHRLLENTFQTTRYLTTESKNELVETTKLPGRTIEVWFKNRRSRQQHGSRQLSLQAGSPELSTFSGSSSSDSLNSQQYSNESTFYDNTHLVKLRKRASIDNYMEKDKVKRAGYELSISSQSTCSTDQSDESQHPDSTSLKRSPSL